MHESFQDSILHFWFVLVSIIFMTKRWNPIKKIVFRILIIKSGAQIKEFRPFQKEWTLEIEVESKNLNFIWYKFLKELKKERTEKFWKNKEKSNENIENFSFLIKWCVLWLFAKMSVWTGDFAWKKFLKVNKKEVLWKCKDTLRSQN